MNRSQEELYRKLLERFHKVCAWQSCTIEQNPDLIREIDKKIAMLQEKKTRLQNELMEAPGKLAHARKEVERYAKLLKHSPENEKRIQKVLKYHMTLKKLEAELKGFDISPQQAETLRKSLKLV